MTTLLPQHEKDFGRTGNPVAWCDRCRIDATATSAYTTFADEVDRLKRVWDASEHGRLAAMAYRRGIASALKVLRAFVRRQESAS